MFDIKENLKKLPDSPGVYIHKDKLGRVIYVGKAISLRRRVRQYFQSGNQKNPKIRAMVSQIAEFEFINTATEMEAFILECNLIKEYRPKYNILLRDDKTYPYIKVTLNEAWPGVVKTRIVKNDGGKYFGPYSDVNAVNKIVELLNDIYILKKCKKQSFNSYEKGCLNYHIGTCEGVCMNRVDREKYMERVDFAINFLKGRNKDFINELNQKMLFASQNLNYEDAAKYRDALAAAESLLSTQRVVLSNSADMDIVLPVVKGEVVIFYVRNGKLTGRDTYSLKSVDIDSESDEIGEFIKLYYSDLTSGPGEILVSEDIKERDIIEKYLGDIWNKKVKIFVPMRGEKKALMDLAKRDASILTSSIKEKVQNKADRENKIAEEIAFLIASAGDLIANGDQKKRYRIEAYDISNMNGVDTVGGMVVFEGTEKDKKAYRRFKIKTVDGQDDYAGMQEMIYRRVRRAKNNDPGFLALPDIMLIDGGKGHVAAVMDVLSAMDEKICVMGMVKDDSHRTRALVYEREGIFEEVPLKSNSILFGYIGRIQEEVHRFAIEYHRELRDRGKLQSVLDEIDGIGKVKRNRLLEYFGGIENIKKAEIEELQKVSGISEKNALSVYRYFH